MNHQNGGEKSSVSQRQSLPSRTAIVPNRSRNTMSGFTGHITLELSNVANLPIMLWPGMKIGQLCLFRLSSAAEFPYGSAQYGSRYPGQRGPTPSRSYQNFRRWPTT